MSVENDRILGGIGALLMFIGVIPYISYFGIIELIGLILVMIALYNFGSHYKEGGIFNNALYAIILGIVGAVVAAAVLFIAVLSNLVSFLQTIFPGWNGTDWAALQGMTPNTSNINFSTIQNLLGGLIATFVIIWIFAIVVAFFFRRSWGKLASKSDVGLFSTAGLLLLIGAVLTIVIIGALLIWIAMLLLAIAFFRIKPDTPMPQTATMPPSPAPPPS